MSYQNHQRLESGIKVLLERLGGALSEKEKVEVMQFVGVGEYGVALETLCGIIMDGQYVIGQGALREIQELGTVMGLDPDFWRQIKADDGN